MELKKHILILLIYLLQSNFGLGQTNVYHPFPNTNAVWRVDSWVGCAPSYITKVHSYYQYTMGGDTTIGLHTYKKIYKSGMFGSSCATPTLTTYNFYYLGGLRQDTMHKKIYFKYASSSCPDTLVYDFGKNVGDTLNVGACVGFTVTITSIDSVLIGSNYRKQFHLYSDTYLVSNTIIEGIGSTSGLLDPIYDAPGTNNWSLVCFSHNTDIYPNTSTSCPLIANPNGIAPINSNIERVVNIYPNPTSNFISVDISNVFNYSNSIIIIQNTLGQTIKKIPFANNIDVSSLAEGCYFLQVTLSSGESYKTKFVKQ